jgi:hypothetical protein
VNNTKSWEWNKSKVLCCEQFFRMKIIDQQFKENKYKGENQDLKYLQTSGGSVLHEMMHWIPQRCLPVEEHRR